MTQEELDCLDRQKTTIARAKEDFPGKSRGQTPCPYGQVDHAYEKMTARRYFEAAAIGILSMDYEHHAGFRSRLVEEKETWYFVLSGDA